MKNGRSGEDSKTSKEERRKDTSKKQRKGLGLKEELNKSSKTQLRRGSS